MTRRGLALACAPALMALPLVVILIADGVRAEAPKAVGPAIDQAGQASQDSVLSTSLSGSQTYLFANPEIPLSGSPREIAVDDFNQDGRPDLVTTASILLGYGDGTFGPESVLEPGASFAGVAAGDLTGDFIPDLALADSNSNTVAVLVGRGDGTFVRQATLVTGSHPTRVLMADLNQDGRLDLVVLDSGSADLSVFLNQGNTTFAPRHPVALPGPINSNGTAMAAADLNSDRYPDVVLTLGGNPGLLSVFLGNGDGTLTSLAPFPAGNNPNAIAFGDWDRDSNLDLAVSNFDSHDVAIFYGAGDGTFPQTSTIPVGGHPWGITSGDLDGDGFPDLVYADPCPEHQSFCERHTLYSALMGRGDGTFEASQIFFWGGPGVSKIVLADLNRDHHLDLVGLEGSSARILLRGDDGRSEYPVAVSLENSGGNSREPVLSGNFTSDGRSELAAVDQNAGEIIVFMPRPDGMFDPIRVSAGVPVSGIAVGDLNGDGLADLIAMSSASGETLALLSNGDGQFLVVGQPIAKTPAGVVAISDFNEDGNQDIVFTSHPGGVMLASGHGDGLFEEPQHVSIGSPEDQSFNPALILTGDFDGDGHRDVLISETRNPPDGYRSLLLGHGDGSFSARFAHQKVASGTLIGPWAVGDFNEDGIDDVAWVGGLGTSLTINLGDGVAPLQANATLGGFGNPAPLALIVADFDKDGHKDLALATQAGQPQTSALEENVQVFPGRGDGTFGGRARFSLGYIVGPLVAGDFNGDGRTDLVAGARDAGGQSGSGQPIALRLMLNQGPYPDSPPVARIESGSQVECTSPAGATVTLDGTTSSDPDSDPDTSNDIVSYDWFENFGSPASISLGGGPKLRTLLPLGIHAITLRVKDRRGVAATGQIVVTVADSAPPALALSAQPSVLWPPKNKLVPVHIAWQATDVCDRNPKVTLQSVTLVGSAGGTAGDIQGAQPGIADSDLLLRATRSSTGSDLVYELTYQATDGAGNSAAAKVDVVVPRDQGHGGH